VREVVPRGRPLQWVQRATRRGAKSSHGFPERFFRNVFRDGTANVGTSSFERLSEEELEAHLGVVRYGDFILTDACGDYDLQVVPSQGYRHDTYHDEESRSSVPVLMGAASKQDLFDVFMNCSTPWVFEVRRRAETSHNRETRGHVDLTASTSTCPCSRAFCGISKSCS